MFKQLLSVFLESRCAFCQRSTSKTLCEYCQQKLSSHQLPKTNCLKLDKDLSVFAWGLYEGQLKRAIALMKYDNKLELGTVLGELLGQAWLNDNAIESRQLTVVPIPLHPKKLKTRGFNQAEVIAKSFCQLTGYSLNSQALIRVRETKAMFELNPSERVKNLQGAFKVGNKLPRHPVLLLDDIYTTGTTIRESVKVLSEKTKVIGVAVVARVENR